MTEARKALWINLRIETDADILVLLDKSGNKTGLVRACIRAVLSRDRQTEEDVALIEKLKETWGEYYVPSEFVDDIEKVRG